MERRTRSLTPLPPVGKPTVRVLTEVPSLDGHVVSEGVEVGLSDDESWSAAGTPRQNDEETTAGTDTGSAGYPAQVPSSVRPAEEGNVEEI